MCKACKRVCTPEGRQQLRLPIAIIIIIIITRWASKRQSHSIEYNDKDTLRHDSLTSLQAGLQVGPVTASQNRSTE
jgi:hypothetical protein